MTEDKMNISWDELKSARVEKHVKQQQAIARNRSYSQMTSEDVTGGDGAQSRGSIWYNDIFCLAVFGLVGGLLAWGCSALLHLRPDPRNEAAEVIRYVQQIHKSVRTSPDGVGITAEQADRAIDNIADAYGGNPYVQLYLNTKLSDAEKDRARDELSKAQEWKDLLANFLSFGLCGLCVSVCLSIAEPIVDHNLPAVIINGSVGALLGLIGGFSAMILVERVYRALGGGEDTSVLRQFAAGAASWALVGCFVSVAPGLVARNFKRLLIGIVGGAIGGTIGGVVAVAMQMIHNPEIGRLLALVLIGIVAGTMTGIIQRATRTGWLKVTSGLIAGKNFILYRNPTYIGSTPDCQIYLFRDPEVGKRHAAIHIDKGRFEIENLPMGGATLVNGEETPRRRLRNGDRIKIGATGFVFQEKAKG